MNSHVQLQRPLPSALPSPPYDKSTSFLVIGRPTNYGLCAQRWHTPFAGACFLYLIRRNDRLSSLLCAAYLLVGRVIANVSVGTSNRSPSPNIDPPVLHGCRSYGNNRTLTLLF